MPRPRAPRLGGRTLAALAAAGLLIVAACGGDDDAASVDSALDERREEVAERGEDVMPFDLDATTHRFDRQADGLVETVTADDPEDAEQIELIREHLDQEAERFAAGDYADPGSIHGEDMPGLAELEAGADDVTVAYEPTPEGGRVTYVTRDAALVDALHRWGKAQTTDHGSHAENSS